MSVEVKDKKPPCQAEERLRDELARAAMQGMLCVGFEVDRNGPKLAAAAYRMADLMIEARKPKEQP